MSDLVKSFDISLTNFGVALIDEQDFDRVHEHRWWADKTKSRASVYVKGYIGARGCGGSRADKRAYNQSRVYLHRFILQAASGLHVDHVNGNGLDNRRCNLRVCTPSQNQGNKFKQIPSGNPFKGITWHRGTSKWMAHIHRNGRTEYLGLFLDPKDAAAAYDSAAREFFGDFALTNFRG